MNFFSTLINGMTPKQKGGLIALFGGLGVAFCGLVAMADGEIQIGTTKIDFNAHNTIGDGAIISSPLENKESEK